MLALNDGKDIVYIFYAGDVGRGPADLDYYRTRRCALLDRRSAVAPGLGRRAAGGIVVLVLLSLLLADAFAFPSWCI